LPDSTGHGYKEGLQAVLALTAQWDRLQASKLAIAATILPACQKGYSNLA
jgi:hypothetical protein